MEICLLQHHYSKAVPPCVKLGRFGFGRCSLWPSIVPPTKSFSGVNVTQQAFSPHQLVLVQNLPRTSFIHLIHLFPCLVNKKTSHHVFPVTSVRPVNCCRKNTRASCVADMWSCNSVLHHLETMEIQQNAFGLNFAPFGDSHVFG